EGRGMAGVKRDRASACLIGRRRTGCRIQTALLGMKDLEDLTILMNEDDPAAGAGRLAIGRRPGLPEPQKADPVLGRPALEANVVSQQGAGAYSRPRAMRRARGACGNESRGAVRPLLLAALSARLARRSGARPRHGRK